MFKKPKPNSFTLIELAVVLTIISMIVIAVLNSKNTIDRSRLNSIISDAKFYIQKAEEFENIYGSLPGDLSTVNLLSNQSPSPIAGNGNGYLDSMSNTSTYGGEVWQFWLHMQLAGLISGDFGATVSSSSSTTLSVFNPANTGVQGSLPSGKIIGSAFTASSDATYGLVISFSGTPVTISGNTTLNLPGILTPAQSYELDNKFDDGIPTSGMIQAVNGYSSASNCISGSAYNSTAASGPVCVLKIYAAKKAVTNSSPSGYGASVCNGYPVGGQRISTSTTCPEGYVGYVLDSCTTGGTWKTYRYLCEPMQCAGGVQHGQTVYSSCPAGTVGKVTNICQYGILQPTAFSCAPANNSASYPTCSNSLYLPNPVGAVAVGLNGSSYNICTPQLQTYSCSANLWSAATPNANCGGYAFVYKPISCNNTTSTTLGTINSTTSGICNTNSYWNAISTINTATGGLEVCIHPTGTATRGNYRLVNNFCAPNSSNFYGNGSCTSGNTRTVNSSGSSPSPSCPYGQTGSVTQRCVSGYWVTTSNTCRQVTCGGAPIGSVRIAAGKTCPNNTSYANINNINNSFYPAQVVEVCDYTDLTYFQTAAWQTSYLYCQ